MVGADKGLMKEAISLAEGDFGGAPPGGGLVVESGWLVVLVGESRWLWALLSEVV